MNIGQIILGTTYEILGFNKDISEERMKICRKCPLFLDRLGGICNSNLYLNAKTGDVSTTYKDGYVKGCGCRCLAKTRLVNARCPNDKW